MVGGSVPLDASGAWRRVRSRNSRARRRAWPISRASVTASGLRHAVQRRHARTRIQWPRSRCGPSAWRAAAIPAQRDFRAARRTRLRARAGVRAGSCARPAASDGGQLEASPALARSPGVATTSGLTDLPQPLKREPGLSGHGDSQPCGVPRHTGRSTNRRLRCGSSSPSELAGPSGCRMIGLRRIEDGDGNIRTRSGYKG